MKKKAFARLANKDGYKCYFSSGWISTDVLGIRKHRGGLAFLVHKSVRHVLASEITHQCTQLLGLWLEGLHLINFYFPPEHGAVGAEALGLYWAAAQMRKHVWLALGDANEEPHNSIIASFFTAHGGTLVPGQNTSTRWNGRRIIDWAFQSRPVVASTWVNSEVKFSDHKGVWFELCFEGRDNRRGRLKPAAVWKKPDGLSSEKWQEALDSTWDSLWDADDIFLQLKNLINVNSPDICTLQQTWDTYMLALNKVYRTAIVGIHAQADGAMERQTRTMLRQSGQNQKGAVAKHQFVTSATRLAGNPAAGESLRKLRRNLARFHEVVRQVQRHGHADPALLRRLWPEEASNISPHDALFRAQESIQNLQRKQTRDESKQKNDNIRYWKSQMTAGSFRPLSRWLQNKVSIFENVSVGSSTTPREAAQAIADYWKSVWADQNVPAEIAAATLAQDFGPTENVVWETITVADLWQAVRKSKGSSGPDQWSGHELQFLPLKAIETWQSIIVRQWFSVKKLPSQLKEAKQISLPKPGKSHLGRVKPEHTRPITVMSIFWRCFASALLQSKSVQTWHKFNLHESVCYGRGAFGAELIAHTLQDRLAKYHGFLATMDFKQAYDRMRPEVSTLLLKRLNWPVEICDLLYEAWGQQHRWISWENETLPFPVHAPATPQGCPLAPLLLAVWTSAGARATHDDRCTLKVYMDDRTLHTCCWDAVMSQISRWEAWSLSVGLKEGPEKTKVIAKGKKHLDLLAKGPQSWIETDMRMLGAVTVSRKRAYHQVEKDRIDKAHLRAVLFRSVGLPWERALEAYKLFVLSVLNYGWLAQPPTQATADKFFSLFNLATHNTARMASPVLRKVVYGAKFYLLAVVLQRLWVRTVKLFNAGLITWNGCFGSSIAWLRKSLKKLGWTERSLIFGILNMVSFLWIPLLTVWVSPFTSLEIPGVRRCSVPGYAKNDESLDSSCLIIPLNRWFPFLMKLISMLCVLALKTMLGRDMLPWGLLFPLLPWPR